MKKSNDKNEIVEPTNHQVGKLQSDAMSSPIPRPVKNAIRITCQRPSVDSIRFLAAKASMSNRLQDEIAMTNPIASNQDGP
jgi:hypothetical protein